MGGVGGLRLPGGQHRPEDSGLRAFMFEYLEVGEILRSSSRTQRPCLGWGRGDSLTEHPLSPAVTSQGARAASRFSQTIEELDDFAVRQISVMTLTRRLACVGALVAFGLILGSCGSSGTGTIVGVYYGMGNVKTHVGGVPSSGTIRVSGPVGSYTATVGDDGRFSVAVLAGTYEVTGRPPGETGGISSCQVQGVHVSAGRTTHVVVTCVFH
jgi:hypothetical protein